MKEGERESRKGKATGKRKRCKVEREGQEREEGRKKMEEKKGKEKKHHSAARVCVP